MSQKLISLNPDLKRLRDEGFEIQVRNGHLLVGHIPYVNTGKKVVLGVLVTPLGDLAGDRTAKPQSHVIFFIGEHPCDKGGNILENIQHGSGHQKLADGVEVDHSFSNKPGPDGYSDYYEKVVNYYRIISHEAQALDPNVTGKTFMAIEADDPEIVFNYLDTNSSRAEIDFISSKLKGTKIAIVGSGGTGSYILDFVAKTHVAEIHLFDKDEFLSHNAFRAPGAPSIEELKKKPKKVQYLQRIYSKMHKHIIPHECHLSSENLEELVGMNFVFLCMDKNAIKKPIIDKLIATGIPFIDVGIGIEAVDEKLTGGARVTTGSVSKNDHIERRIPFSDGGKDDYDANIQIAEINALNAALAVIKWKKMFGLYHDLVKEHNSSYAINVNRIQNDETIP